MALSIKTMALSRRYTLYKATWDNMLLYNNIAVFLNNICSDRLVQVVLTCGVAYTSLHLSSAHMVYLTLP